ncbi:hypothetical protein CK203_052520 [Vitis vinifera]|uniref:Uncharacterized protein n=1 Tax=Vitis vinifera TaxID=29760 RepID=A0A438GID4_VITVI|nr:hypothetical protein CK203_052520 [Vitis vinifera]
MGDLLEKVPIPKDDNPKFETWEAENSMIMPWLLHSIQPEISKPLPFLSTAKEIWEAMTHSYSKKLIEEDRNFAFLAGLNPELDQGNKRPEFTAWLAEIKQVNLESLPNWEEKQMFKEFMEDHNTATFTSKKYYNIDAYYRQKMEREMKKGSKKALETERTVFNDEEQRRYVLVFLLNAVLPILDERALCITWKQLFLSVFRIIFSLCQYPSTGYMPIKGFHPLFRLELQRERERYKEVQVEELKRSMQSGMVSFYPIFLQAPDITISCFWPLRPGSMAQAMKEQAQLREEMAYQYKVGNSEAAAAIQRRLDPDVAM